MNFSLVWQSPDQCCHHRCLHLCSWWCFCNFLCIYMALIFSNLVHLIVVSHAHSLLFFRSFFVFFLHNNSEPSSSSVVCVHSCVCVFIISELIFGVVWRKSCSRQRRVGCAVHKCVHRCMYVCVCVRVHVYMCVCMCMCMCMCACEPKEATTCIRASRVWYKCTYKCVYAHT